MYSRNIHVIVLMFTIISCLSVILSPLNYTASSTTKTGRHDIAEILLKGALKHQKSNQIKSI
jgi:hypothetical protein